MPFFLIHDSFGTTAAKTELMFHVIRDSFIQMYSDESWYGNLREQVLTQLDSDKKVPNSPVEGELNLEDVAISNYCFS
jgi:DNA-directed RNA polymerase